MEFFPLFSVGFLQVRIWDILDILIVGFLIYQIYKLLRGNIAFNIFIGVLILYMIYWLVKELKMDLLAAVLDQFVSVGVIVIIIIFQPEVRRFLLFLGNTTIKQRSNFFKKLLDKNFEANQKNLQAISWVANALLQLAQHKIGAIVVMTKGTDLEGIVAGGIQLNAVISEQLIISIFNKNSPLHDGAVIIDRGLVQSASVVLPVSEKPELSPLLGLRHRAAVGLTERTNAAVFVVSEETGKISFAENGTLRIGISKSELMELLEIHFY
jgi:diadenylate cyclase